MDLDSYLSTISESAPDDWSRVHEPLYLSALSTNTSGKTTWVESSSPYMVMAYKRDLSIAMATGMKQLDDFKEPWANCFPDPHARSYYLDFFFNGMLILRDVTVSVDGGRVGLPLPKMGTTSVPRRRYSIGRLVDRLSGGTYDYDEYLHRSGLTVADLPWPE